MLKHFKELRHSSKSDYLEGSRDLVFRNTFPDPKSALRTCAGNGYPFQFQCSDSRSSVLTWLIFSIIN